MALNTPKRIKTLQTFINSPSSDCGSIWRDYSGASDGGSGGVGSGGGGAITIHEHQLGESNGNNVTNAGHATTGSLSPASSCDSPEFNIRHPNNGTINNVYNMYGADARENRRGRPRSEALTTLMIEGSTSPSAIKCTYCNRVFPREKSLQAHLRTHTGELSIGSYIFIEQKKKSDLNAKRTTEHLKFTVIDCSSNFIIKCR